MAKILDLKASCLHKVFVPANIDMNTLTKVTAPPSISPSFDGGHGPSKFFPIDTTPALMALLTSYASNQQPLKVSFREMVPWVHGGNRATHYLHSYPAKLLPQIAHFFLATSYLCPEEGTVLDPFSGSGTVMLEAALSGRQGLFCDANPFARFLTQVKTSPIQEETLRMKLALLKEKYFRSRSRSLTDIVNINYWYTENVAIALSNLKRSISAFESDVAQDFFLACLSIIGRKLSLADLRFTVPVRDKKLDLDYLKNLNKSDVWARYSATVDQALTKIRKLPCGPSFRRPICVGADARELLDQWNSIEHPPGSIDFVLTSPPYAGAQKYVRASSLSMGWVGQVRSTDLASLEAISIGREHISKKHRDQLLSTIQDGQDDDLQRIRDINPVRAAITKEYLLGMTLSVKSIMDVLRPDGYAVVVMGDNTISGSHFPTAERIARMFEATGAIRRLELQDVIRSRALQTRRAGGISHIKHESVYVFQKVGQEV